MALKTSSKVCEISNNKGGAKERRQRVAGEVMAVPLQKGKLAINLYRLHILRRQMQPCEGVEQ